MVQPNSANACRNAPTRALPYLIVRGCGQQHGDAPHALGLLRARRNRPRSRVADERDELAPFHYPMPPVLPNEMIAHLDTADF
jgi:hypothetical protein